MGADDEGHVIWLDGVTTDLSAVLCCHRLDDLLPPVPHRASRTFRRRLGHQMKWHTTKWAVCPSCAESMEIVS